MSAKGYVTRIGEATLKGWAVPKNGATGTVTIVVKVGGIEKLRIIADEVREQVKKDGLHDSGVCGFRIDCSAFINGVTNERVISVGVYVEAANGRLKELTNSPVLICPADHSITQSKIAESFGSDRFPVIRFASPTRQRTIVVMGVARGGTSMVSACLSTAGLFMGEKLSRDSHEDTEFVKAQSIAEIRTIVEKRNEGHDVWGWKHPASTSYIGQLRQSLRNPRYIFIYRNEFDVARSYERRGNLPMDQALREANDRYRTLSEVLLETNDPSMLISYENAVKYPDLFIGEMLEFCGLSAGEDVVSHCLQVITPGEYVRRLKIEAK